MADPDPTVPEAGSDTAVDLTNCDREPIHTPGRVQDYGALIAVTTDWMVNHASTNVIDYVGVAAEELIGRNLSDVIPRESIHAIRGRVQLMARSNAAARMFAYDLMQNGVLYDISIHDIGRTFIIEVEERPDTSPELHDPGQLPALTARIKRHSDQDAMSREIVRLVKAVAGFDRVMLYLFEPDGSGTVVAEEREAHLEPFLGLRYPASDIPKQARALYLRQLVRLIWDVDGETHPIVPQVNPDGEPLDMSMSVTRAVSPIHLEYLRNMGVKASMSVSVIVNGELVGLIACHHNAPKRVSFETRTLIELMGQIFSYELSEVRVARERDLAQKARKLHDRFVSRVSSGMNLFGNLDAISAEISEAIEFDGIALFSDGRYAARGLAPSQHDFEQIARFLNTAKANTVFQTDRLIERLPAAGTFDVNVAGILALPISRTPRDFIVLFRREVAKSITWAGDPKKPVNVGPHGTRLTPRGSFAAWRQIVKSQSAPWTDAEISTADALRITVMEVVLKITDASSRERKAANEKQELLIAELNHRVRNILNLIRGLVSRSKEDVNSIEDFTRVLDGRIQALARAHDQLTETEWNAASIKGLIQVEVAAFMPGNDMARLAILGADQHLEPSAFSTMSLVIHELMTNSVKYGALSVPAGRVVVNLHRDGRGLWIDWREEGGPLVTPPNRRGFGTTIIERSLPYELKGEAEMQFHRDGLRARLMIPGRFVNVTGSDGPEPTMPPSNRLSDVPVLAGQVLLLEDNMIIALDAEDMLRDLGASEVHVCGNVQAALAVAERAEIQVAVLDVHLGDETSLSVARRLADMGVPFVFATGYGADARELSEFADRPVLKKPYVASTLSQSIAEALSTA